MDARMYLLIVVVSAIVVGWLWPQSTSSTYPATARRHPPAKINTIQKTSLGSTKKSNSGDCTYLCGSDGFCDSPTFFECLTQQSDRFGVSGRQGAAFDPYSRKLDYVQDQSIW